MTPSLPPTPPVPEICSYVPVRSDVGATDPCTDRKPSLVRHPCGHPAEGATTLSARAPTSEQSSVYASSRLTESG